MNDKPQKSAIAVFREQAKSTELQNELAGALPAHIPPERFTRVVLTAVQNNPELLACDRRSLFNAAMQSANDGLLPDGREAAMVVRWSKEGKKAAYQPMVQGIRKKVRNSGEIASWDVGAVFSNDEFSYQLGDDAYVHHRPALSAEPGDLVAVYSIVTFKSGEKSRDVMSIGAVRKIRDQFSDGWKAYKAGKIKSTPWSSAEEEMAKKTIVRRHAKTLPMSSDLDDLLRRDDDLYSFDNGAAKPDAPSQPKALADQLDQLAGPQSTSEEVIDTETGEIIDGEAVEVEGDVDEGKKQDRKPGASKGKASSAKKKSGDTGDDTQKPTKAKAEPAGDEEPAEEAQDEERSDAGEPGRDDDEDQTEDTTTPVSALTDEDLENLFSFSEALMRAQSNGKLASISGSFWPEHGGFPDEETLLYRRLEAIYDLHIARVDDKIGPVDLEKEVKALLLGE